MEIFLACCLFRHGVRIGIFLNKIMKTLHLILKKQWFDMILAGEKLEEYRELKEYYFLRFLKCYKDIREGNSKFECKKATCSACLVRANGGRFIDFDTITFSHGYAKNRRQFVVELKEIKIDKGRPEWGAEYNKEYFVLKLGEIISKNNYI